MHYGKIALALAVVAATACKPRGESARVMAAVDALASRQYLSQRPFLKPSEAFAKLSPDAQDDFLKGLLGAARGMLGPDLGGAGIATAFGIDPGKAKAAAVEDLLPLVKAELTKHPAALDAFPRVPMARVKAIQRALLAKSTVHPAPVTPPLPFGLPDDPSLDIPGPPAMHENGVHEDGCEPPRWQKDPVFGKAGFFVNLEPMQAGIVPCYDGNSRRLARAMNRTADHGAYADLLEALADSGYAVELYVGHEIANFFELWLDTGDGPASIRLALYLDLQIGGQAVSVPAEHAEFNLAVSKDGRRYAGLRWYFGLPVDAAPGLSVYWRPDAYERSPWGAFAGESFASGPDEILARLDAAAAAMRGLRNVQAQVEAPLNGYGLYVCIDSVVLAATQLPALTERLTAAFPVMRLRQAETTDLDAMYAAGAGTAFRGDAPLYLPDDELYARDPEAARARLLAAFPDRTSPRLAAFPEAQAALDALR